jgi:hypothetical protein
VQLSDCLMEAPQPCECHAASTAHDHSVDLPIGWLQGIPDAVTAVSWHPEKQDVLALGCADGAVAVLDTVKGEAYVQYSFSVAVAA